MSTDTSSVVSTSSIQSDWMQWLQTPAGQYLLQWEQLQFDEALCDVFGYHALQLGLPQLDTLRANRMPRRWMALPEFPETDAFLHSEVALPEQASVSTQLITHAAALPFQEASLDLVVLPHTLELSADPHAVLSEVHRVLVPEGRVALCGFNPWSLWGLRQSRAHAFDSVGLGKTWCGRWFLPQSGEFIALGRLRDWLKLLGFEMIITRHGCFRPALQNQRWLDRFEWMDGIGRRSWPFFGASYFVVAVKKVRGMRILGPAWKPRSVSRAQIAVQRPSVGRETLSHQHHHSDQHR
jgi:SAM-dependent methyltransferase